MFILERKKNIGPDTGEGRHVKETGKQKKEKHSLLVWQLITAMTRQFRILVLS